MVYKAWENSLYIKKNNAYHVLNQDIYANYQYLTVELTYCQLGLKIYVFELR